LGGDWGGQVKGMRWGLWCGIKGVVGGHCGDWVGFIAMMVISARVVGFNMESGGGEFPYVYDVE